MKTFIATILCSSLFVSACASSQSNAELIQIGVIAPMTGDAAAYGEEVKNVLDYQISMVNEASASQGYQFELLYEDGQCGTAATTAFQKLTDVDGVNFILGGLCSSESLAIAPLLEGKNIVAVSALSSSPELDGISPNFLSLSYNDAGVGEGIAEKMSDYTSVAFLTEQNDYNIALYDTVMAHLDKNVQVLADETVEKGATDFRNALQKIKAAEPDAVFFNVNAGITAQTMLKQLFEIDGWEVTKIGSFTLMDDDYIALSPEKMEGFVVIDTPKINSTEFLAVQEAITVSQGSTENIGAYYTAATLDALNVLTTAILAADADPAQTLKELRSKSYEGYIGTIRFDQETFVQGIGTAVYSVKGGAWVQE